MSDNKATVTVTADPTIKVIGAGLGRTGTTSLKEALEVLGYGPCHHMSVVPRKPAMIQGFVDAYQGKPVDFKVLLAGYGSVVDNPGSDFVHELMTAFPDAKVILTVRDTPEGWWKSTSDTVLKTMVPSMRVLTFSLGFGRSSLWNFMRVPTECRLSWIRKYGELGPGTYVKHNAAMLEIIPKDKLLVFNVKEGWEPLCNFLGVKVPGVPFPRVNESAQFKKMVFGMRTVALTAWTVELSVVGVIVWQVIRRRLWEAVSWRELFSS